MDVSVKSVGTMRALNVDARASTHTVPACHVLQPRAPIINVVLYNILLLSIRFKVKLFVKDTDTLNHN